LPYGQFVSDIAYGEGSFVACVNHDFNGSILTSSNGFHWQVAAELPSYPLYGVAYGNGRFVIRTEVGAVSSTDGVNWTHHLGPLRIPWSYLVFGNGLFLTSSGGTLWSSSDGMAWTECGASGDMIPVAAGEGVFLAYGFNPPNLYQSGPLERLENPRWVSNVGLEWTVTGAPRIDYRIEFSEDLLNWHTLSRVTDAPASYPFIDPDVVVRPSRFYRVVAE
jgi:hypothetical protein